MMNLMIIEDEQLASDRLRQLILKRNPQYNILGQCDTVRDSVKTLSEAGEKIDLLFCDIQLADGLSFSIFDQVKVDSPVIFTTAYDQYSLRAFEHNSIDYLLKPVKYEDLDRAFGKYEKYYEKPSLPDQIAELRQYFEKAQYKQRFLLQIGSKFYHKKAGEIAFFHIDNGIVYAYPYENGKRFSTDYTLDELATEHLDPNIFFRINRKTIVNIEAIEMFKSYVNQRLQLKLRVATTEEMVVSREKVANFKKWFDD
jgi:DNA-binding LytR/AlgR family response regulator